MSDTKLPMNIEEYVSLADYTTLGVGGKARYWMIAATTVDLIQGVTWALKKEIPYCVLGGGSNVIVSDKGFDGLVIKNESKEILIDELHSVLQVDSGVKSGKAAATAASANLSGLEFLFGIPGTIGGAVYGNAGLRGHETKDVVKDIICLEVKNGTPIIVKHTHAWMQYEYRSSRLKKLRSTVEHPPIILTVRLQLYPARREVIMQRTKEFLQHRRGGMMEESAHEHHGTQPTGLKTAGCAFRNPSSDPQQAAGRLLESVGAKRMTRGGAAVSKEHANFIYNKKSASADDVIELMRTLQQAVYDTYGIMLKREVELLGDFDYIDEREQEA